MISQNCILNIPSKNIEGLTGQGIYEVTLPSATYEFTDRYYLYTENGNTYSVDICASNTNTTDLTFKFLTFYKLQLWANSTAFLNYSDLVIFDVLSNNHPSYSIGLRFYENDTVKTSGGITIGATSRYNIFNNVASASLSTLSQYYGHTPTSSEYILDTSKTRLWFDGVTIANFLTTYVPELFNNVTPEDTDPYANGGTTDTGGGSGSFDYTSDTIPLPDLPTVGAAATGFVSLFNPTTAQLQALNDYLWSPLFDLDTIKRLYADPMQQFIGLSLVPVPVPSAGTKTIQVGGVSTGIALNYVASTNQFVEVDCGTITFSSSNLTASYLDYLPYTKTQLYLPYIGIVDVSTDDIMDKAMHIYYHVDILTGGCIAYISVGGSVMYQYSGECAINIPLTSQDWSTTISSALNLVSSAMGGLVSAIGVPLTGGAGVAKGIGAVANMGASAVNAAVNSKPTISKSGAIGGSAGVMAVQKPFLIVTCPNLARAKKQDYYIGYPSYITKSISECSGFCSFEEIYLSGLGLTDDEMEELNIILKEGVYL